MQKNLSSPTLTARVIGYSGLIPFIGLSAISVLWHDIHHSAVLFSLLAYGATIVSFLGAIHWGLTMREERPDGFAIIWGVIPSLLAWISLILDTRIGLVIQLVTLCICLAVDLKRYPRLGVSGWLKLRLQLTFVAVICIAFPVLM
ncbi:MAG: DUF3429 domain-containing protein [Limnohabitans sp.]